MGYRKSDCQFDCRYDAYESAYWESIPADAPFGTTGTVKYDDYLPKPGDPQWERYVSCMDICEEIGLYNDSAFTAPWPPQ